jgi:hypothetical protein
MGRWERKERLGVEGCLERAVCPVLCVPMENLSQEFCEGGFLHSFREQMKGLHDLLMQEPSPQFILLVGSSISVVFLMIHSSGHPLQWCLDVVLVHQVPASGSEAVQMSHTSHLSTQFFAWSQ